MKKSAAQAKGRRRRGLKSNDFISRMPDDILLIILSLLPLKEAVVTGSLSTRWRFLWCMLLHLEFDSGETLDHIAADRKLLREARSELFKQVNGVIGSYNQPVVQHFRIRFDLYDRDAEVIDRWLQFAANKNVESLELDFLKSGYKIRNPFCCYDFPLRLSARNIQHVSGLPSMNVSIVELNSLSKLVLKGVNVCDTTLQEFLRNSPQLKTLCIHRSAYLTHIEVGGRPLNLRHLEITNCCEVESIYLFKFNLVLFVYNGPAIDLRLTGLPKLKELDIDRALARLENNVFGQVSSCFSHLQVLSFKIGQQNKLLFLHSVPELPNVKNLRLTIGAHEDECLLGVASVAKLCPNLETFLIKLLWVSPIISRRNVRRAATHPHKHLELLEIQGYYGRVSELELVAYFIDNAVALKEIFIDPRNQAREGTSTSRRYSKTTEEAARSFAKQQLQPLTPRGVKLMIL